MVASARRLAQATAQMIADIKAQAELSGDDPDRQSRLFAAAKQLADATTNLIDVAKVSDTCIPLPPPSSTLTVGHPVTFKNKHSSNLHYFLTFVRNRAGTILKRPSSLSSDRIEKI